MQSSQISITILQNNRRILPISLIFLFENNHPIHLELGTGRGEFIINMAKAYPHINFIGIEKNTDITLFKTS